MKDENKFHSKGSEGSQAEDADPAAEKGWSTILGRKDVKKLLKDESASW